MPSCEQIPAVASNVGVVLSVRVAHVSSQIKRPNGGVPWALDDESLASMILICILNIITVSGPSSVFVLSSTQPAYGGIGLVVTGLAVLRRSACGIHGQGRMAAIRVTVIVKGRCDGRWGGRPYFRDESLAWVELVERAGSRNRHCRS